MIKLFKKRAEDGFQVLSDASLSRCSRILLNLASFHMKQTKGNTKVKETRIFVQQLQNLNESSLYLRFSTTIFSGVLSKIYNSYLNSTRSSSNSNNMLIYIGTFYNKYGECNYCNNW